jgi:hypothetical protein
MGLFSAIGSGVSGILGFVKGLLSDGTEPSSTRFLMVVFSFATVRILFLVIHHLTELKDIGLLGIWLGNLPLLIASLIGLISTPYAINRGVTSLNNVASMITSVKMGQATPPPVTPTTDTKAAEKTPDPA